MADEKDNTANAGAEPANNTETAGAEPAKKDAGKSESSTDSVPWDKDPRWKSARLAEKTLNDLMKANGVDDPADLVDIVRSGRKVHGKQVDLDRLDEIVAKATKLEQYEAYWKEQEERKRRSEEDPEQTIARLEKELKRKEGESAQRDAARQQAEEAKRAIRAYESDVKDLLDETEGIPKDAKPFVLELFGVGNPANEIDITDRKAIRKMVSDGVKKWENLRQAIIRDYLAGKKEIPKMSGSSGVADEKKPLLGFKNLRAAFHERMKADT